MKPKQLLVRCYAKREGDLWLAFCLDFSLGAQGDTFEEARQKLDEQIREYVHDALAGEDREHAEVLLTRRAPLQFWLEYLYIKAVVALHRVFHSSKQPASTPFKGVLPMVPSIC